MILSVENIRAGYGRIPVLNGISFAVGEHEVVGILGHNGMGKTTLLKALIGQLLSPVLAPPAWTERLLVALSREAAADAEVRRAVSRSGWALR